MAELCGKRRVKVQPRAPQIDVSVTIHVDGISRQPPQSAIFLRANPPKREEVCKPTFLRRGLESEKKLKSRAVLKQPIIICFVTCLQWGRFGSARE
ncbi:hypothetical protein N7539_003306 [Penicillium diatomitis]|uniref:Uncharacterized protein n=1 Tax=Penicillium diatomitis TaxID=2819901 RepID=A0A9W9XGD7_9EURO|nr:uncharacterized protein N7539_003306 [Penicillium diatomitis]KAJ5491739.1 hypothetical protein N7539_003306 [Penicillium diatomitis]